ncbi:MAG: TetR/AcrR family transcriptional regulator [Microbacterium sp.]|uniref:TetR/AcrR family transcriptional regulator n=1 Tax=Microbacterium sp. TaxID=51671 RepID=UPI0039E5F567
MKSTPVKPRQRGPRSDAQRNDQLILETAARVLADDPNATIQRIADEAGLARLTVYRRYRNRDELRRAIFEAAATEVRETIDLATDSELDALTALRAFIQRKTVTAQRYPLLAVGEDLQPRPGQGYRPATPPASRAMHQATFELIKRGQRDGVLRTDVPPEMLALAITGTVRLATRFAAALRLDVDRIGDQTADLLLDGFASRTESSPHADR